MSDLFLGTIAVSVLLMAIVQVATILWATRTAKRVGETIARLEQEIRPVLASLQAMAADAARVSAMAAAQADKVDQMLGVVRQLDGIAQMAGGAGFLGGAGQALGAVQTVAGMVGKQ